jgi:hypothetical protein
VEPGFVAVFAGAAGEKRKLATFSFQIKDITQGVSFL